MHCTDWRRPKSRKTVTQNLLSSSSLYDSLFIYTIYSCRSVTHSTYCIMHVLFKLCNLKLADQFTQILSLTAHLLTGSRPFLG
nr:MAG TPA: hypothetical protein [Caudoviricetes sp.]